MATLGLDFGTHQSKLCLRDGGANNYSIYFIEFETPEGNKTTLFPSLIQINDDNTISIGYASKNPLIQYSPKPLKPTIPPAPPLPEMPAEPEKPNIPSELKEPIKPTPPTLQIPTNADYIEVLAAQKKFMEEQENYAKNLSIYETEIEIYNKEYPIWIEKYKNISETYNKKYAGWQNRCNNIKNKHRKEYNEECNRITQEYKNQLQYWEKNSKHPQKYKYFKLATFSNEYKWDVNYIVESDILSVWYITYLLLTTKQQAEKYLNLSFYEDIAIQMGIPVSADKQANIIRYCALKLMVAARNLMEHFNSPDEMLNIDYRQLLEITKILLNTKNVKTAAEDYSLMVLPEAFAGLLSLTNARNLTRANMHLLVDIGGGTTDIAIFTITQDTMKTFIPNIAKMKSFHKGLNFVLETYCQKHHNITMEEAQELFFQNHELFTQEIETYTNQLQNQLKEIINEVIEDYNRYANLPLERLTDAMNGRPIVYCGGGATYSNMRTKHKYFNNIRLIKRNTLNIQNLRNQNITENIFTILATAYGLSIPQIDYPEMTPLTTFFQEIGKQIQDSVEKHNDTYIHGLTDI